MEHKAVTICFHLILSCAACCASPHVRFAIFSSEVTVLRQVVFGLPCFLFPGGVHLKATLGMLFWSIRRTCPSHLSRLCLISSTTFRQLVFLYRSLFEIFSGQKIRQIFRRHPLWKELSLFISLSITLQHSEPYSKTDLTLLLYSWILVFRLFKFPDGLYRGRRMCYELSRALLRRLCCKHCPY